MTSSLPTALAGADDWLRPKGSLRLFWCPVLDGAGVLAVVGELVATGVAQHVGMGGNLKPRGLAGEEQRSLWGAFIVLSNVLECLCLWKPRKT